MRLVVGLGNPGFKYARTRHNIGFRVLDSFAEKNKVKIKQEKQKALTGKLYIKGEKVILAKPQTYMNKSGQAVKGLVDWYQFDPQDIIVIYDDLDLEPGHLRIRRSGGHGGHKGLKSIFNSLNTREIPRIRIGIGRPPKYMSVSEYVLGKFTAEQSSLIEDSVERAQAALKVILADDLTTAMNKYN
ncbi:aminoacyl-tRNA hydrolase [Fuchsiella alkaliacetigena]|uniref:aminoacyl-tRNA hydrolase n=1 Tax=Fuchsiella alkaliacetigena TaxID=957042 RepID=UPI00200B54B2|nr:aminoacyl-tRNA hydrolase [Fuchsiella alkaliacetigena]MCK8824914.1 aminoacyl-tRNA hydrolase [Fuchsiella alkaliacetigena]